MMHRFAKQRVSSALCVAALAVSFFLAPNAFGTLITTAGDPALSGALIQDFNSEAADTYFPPRPS